MYSLRVKSSVSFGAAPYRSVRCENDFHPKSKRWTNDKIELWSVLCGRGRQAILLRIIKLPLKPSHCTKTQLRAITINKCRYNQPSLVSVPFAKMCLVRFSQKAEEKKIRIRCVGIEANVHAWLGWRLGCVPKFQNVFCDRVKLVNFWCQFCFYSPVFSL